jgi:hypothetical protein
MPIDAARCSGFLRDFDFASLFIEELGWDRHRHRFSISIDNRSFTLDAIAEKRGLAVYTCSPDSGDSIPDYATRRKIEREASKVAYEHLIIFINAGRSTQIWQWVRRERGKPTICREHTYHNAQSGDSLLQKLHWLFISLDEEESLTTVGVTQLTRQAFDIDRVTRRFYDRFKKEHDDFVKFIKGIEAKGDRDWYASLMLNRLMFVYFIQKKGFLSGDPDYLRNRLRQTRERRGKDKFLTFYRHFLLRLFHEGLGQQKRTTELDALLGRVPYLNGGLFDVHELERQHKGIEIEDRAFEKIFDFFDAYQWHLDERPLRNDNEINPDVLGYIFEKYINQKQMGAYYTKEDITDYIGKNTIIPYLFDAAEKKCAIAFKPDGAVWSLLRDNPDRYIYEAMRKGVDQPLPKPIAAGLSDVSKRDGWNRPADEEYALPTETWREHIARRRRCEELREKLKSGEVRSINDLITFNLDIRQFAQDAIENCEGPELLRAFYQTMAGRIPERSNEKYEPGISILDPTCGSGAFLFAALNILEPLYQACLDRMEGFVAGLEVAGEQAHPEKFRDFRRVLEEVRRHPNERYFILKTIILNNLYGVDIMEEAVEICKLRLFLKLVAQVDAAEQIEPLPDIDFNIRAGNTLVGYASYDDVQRAVGSKLDFDNAMGRIDESAEIADRAYQKFREMQVGHGMEAHQFAEAKGELRRRLRDLNYELDSYLASEYGADPNKATVFAKWRASYHPFHWFVEFYGIIRNSGFHIIIGNPPYIELREVTDYQPKGYSCEGAGNLYALVMERCLSLCDPNGRSGFIVPVSSVSTDRYRSLQDLLSKYCLHYSSYDDRPSRLFDGLEHIRLTIHLIGKKASISTKFSTRYNKWLSVEREFLFQRLEYSTANESLIKGSLPKFTCALEARILEKLKLQGQQLNQNSKDWDT